MKPFTWALLSGLLSYWLFATVFAPFPYRLDKSLWRTYDSLSRFDPATVLEQRFPNVAEQDRKHIGQVPQNLDVSLLVSPHHPVVGGVGFWSNRELTCAIILPFMLLST